MNRNSGDRGLGIGPFRIFKNAFFDYSDSTGTGVRGPFSIFKNASLGVLSLLPVSGWRGTFFNFQKCIFRSQ